ncbi:MAG TPA: hypothetical protein VH253_00295 [Phycisphaerae bacterium]|nr:hypothetical protein [Phycisphaerae bacterium]
METSKNSREKSLDGPGGNVSRAVSGNKSKGCSEVRDLGKMGGMREIFAAAARAQAGAVRIEWRSGIF